MKKTIIAGSRSFTDYALLEKTCDQYEISEVVCGLADGADTLGFDYAKEKRMSISFFSANWRKYGQSAGRIRNTEMAMYAERLIAFWDGKSPGTKHMISEARKRGLEVVVINF